MAATEPTPDGWVVLSRKLFPSDLWIGRREAFCQRAALIDLLQLAAHSPHVKRIQGREIGLQPGELITSTRRLADRWGWSRAKAQRFLLALRKRGTLTLRPAWNPKTSSTVPPTIYAFPKYLAHQRRVSQESEPGNTPVTKGDSPPTRARRVSQENQERARRVSQEREPGNNPVSIGDLLPPRARTVSQEGEPGLDQSEPGNTPATIDDPPIPESGTKRRYPLERRELEESTLLYGPNLFPELSNLNGDAHTFEIVSALADVADRYGQDPTNRGLNINILLRHIQDGRNPAHLAHAIRGMRAIIEAGELAHIPPGSPFTLAAIFKSDSLYQHSRPIYSAALELSPATDAVPYDPLQH